MGKTLVAKFNPSYLFDHFNKHASLLGLQSALEYEQMASDFLVNQKGRTVVECTRKSNGDLLRFDSTSEEFGVISGNGVIRTYYKLVYCGSLRHIKGCHKQPTHLAYFQRECMS